MIYDSCLMKRIMHGEDRCENKKSLFPVSEQSYLEHSNYPLIKEIED